VVWACVLTKKEIAQKLSLFSGIQAASAVAFSIPAGMGIAWVLVKIVNRKAFGFSLEFSPQAQVFAILAFSAFFAGAIGSRLMAQKLLKEINAAQLKLE
jgi:hypothetical protein